MKLSIVTIFLLIAIYSHGTPLLSEEKSTEPTAPLTIVTIENTLPFSFTLPDGAPSGLYIEFWQLWSETNNIPVKFVLLPYNEGIQLVRQKKTIHSGLFKTAQREEWADFSLPIHNVQTGFIYNSSVKRGAKFRELKNIKVSAHQLSFQEMYMRENYPDTKLTTYQNFDEGISQLLNNEVQALFGEIPSVSARLAQKGLSGVFIISDEVITSNNVFALIAKGQPELLEQINQGIENIPINKIIELEEKWLPTIKPFFADASQLANLTLAEKKWLKQHTSLNLGVHSNWSPYEYMDDSNNHSGIAADYIQHIEKKLSIKLEENRQLSWHQSLARLENKSIDVMAAIVRTPEREKKMLFTDPYFSVPTVIVSRKNGFNADSLESLAGRSVGVIESTAELEFITRDNPSLKIVPLKSMDEGLALLSNGKLDSVIGVTSSVNVAINDGHYSDLIITGFSPYRLEISMAVRSDLEPLVGILNKVFANMSEKEKIAIANNWLSIQLNTGTPLSTIVAWVVPIVSFLMLIIFMYSRMNRKFKDLSLTDQLTGLRNRRFIQNNLDRETDHILRVNSKSNSGKGNKSESESVHIFFLMDIDYFKPINDVHGHKAGDQVLIQIRAILEKVFRKTDYLVRWGGEEFLVITRFSNREQAPELAERLRQTVEDHGFDIGSKKTLKKTCSIGFACYPFVSNNPDLLSWEQVIDIADHCMYSAKNSVRNAWVGLTNNNCDESDIHSGVIEHTQRLIESEKLTVESSISDSQTLRWK